MHLLLQDKHEHSKVRVQILHMENLSYKLPVVRCILTPLNLEQQTIETFVLSLLI